MKENIKYRVVTLIQILALKRGRSLSIRSFCLEHEINYKSLHNAFKADSMGIGLVDKFKSAVPELNMNWFLYGEGKALIDPETTQ
jgi:hypothetical protein